MPVYTGKQQIIVPETIRDLLRFFETEEISENFYSALDEEKALV